MNDTPFERGLRRRLDQLAEEPAELGRYTPSSGVPRMAAAIAAGVLVVVAVAAVVVLLGDDDPAAITDASSPSTDADSPVTTDTTVTTSPGATDSVTDYIWSQLPDSPLSPRESPVMVWTGTEVLVIGGSGGPPCPPTADCVSPGEPLTDGAAYDPATRTWRMIVDVPQQIVSAAQVIPFEGCLYVLTGDGYWRYDIAADEWRDLGAPPATGALVVGPSGLVVFQGSDEQGELPDYIWDEEHGSWQELPNDPLGPSFGRNVIMTSRGIVLLANDLVANPGSEEPSLVRAALLDPTTDQWTTWHDTESLQSGGWIEVGGRLVNPALCRADGGEVNNWGRFYPCGGVIDLTDGAWSPLPEPLPAEEYEEGYAWLPSTGRLLGAGYGWLLDAGTDTWVRTARRDEPLHQGESIVWAGDRWVTFGGAVFDDSGGNGTLLDTGWQLASP